MAIQKTLSPHTIGCYLKWLRLKASKEYRDASQEILRLHEQLREADECLGAAYGVYRPYLEPSVPDSTDKQVAQQKYWAAHEAATKAQEAVTNKEAEACKRFDLIQWWDPDDLSTTIDNADCVVSPSFSVVVVEPPPDKRVDWNTKIKEEMRRTLKRQDFVLEPPRKRTKADKEGWLTLKVNLSAPLEQSELAIRRLLRFNREDPPKTRNRPDKDAEALETWVCYEENKTFSVVARQLRRPVNTVKGQYVRACVLIYGQTPSGSIKQRRAHFIKDPAAEFQAHFGSCSRCQKAKDADAMCPKMKAYVIQDSKALREPLQ